MSTPILVTKLFIPPIRSEFVSRPKLLDRLDAGLDRKLTLISAPAGFGKTTLISSWIQSMGDDVSSLIAIAWFSLDEGDNDLAQFLTYFITALIQAGAINEQFGSGIRDMLQSPQPPPSSGILTSLINEISSSPDQIIFVLDDYHRIQAQSIHEALIFLLEHLPMQMHLVIVTREDPPLPQARLRARNQLSELRANDLRFTSAEAAEFFNQVMGLSLSSKDIAKLETRTEGWIAGLQLAAISMQNSQDVNTFIQSFAGSHRYVLDYLIEEVLEQQPESVQTFMLQTAILDRLTGPLCDAVTGQENGQDTLEMLDRANLFIVPLDNERRWYRYHHLFADLLGQRLNQTQSGQLAVLHCKASKWHEQNGFMDEAVEHALQGKDFERTAYLIENQADAVWMRGEHIKLRHWLAGLPIELLISKPYLCIFQAWELFTSGQLDAAEGCLQAAEKALHNDPDMAAETLMIIQDQLNESGRMKIQGRVATIRAFLAFHEGDIEAIHLHSRQALENLPENDLIWRNNVTVALGDGYSLGGDLNAASRIRLETWEVSSALGNTYINLIASMKLAVTLRQQGKLDRVKKICQQQLLLANESGLSHTAEAGWILAIWGEVLAEQGNLDEANNKTQKGSQLTEGGDMAVLNWCNLCLIRVLFSGGDIVGAEAIIKKMDDLAKNNVVPPWITNMQTAWRVRLWLVQDKLEEASQWVREQGLDATGEPGNLHDMEYIALARILIAKGRSSDALNLLQRILMVTEERGHTSKAIEILILQALAFQAGGDTTQAMPVLERALAQAEPGGFLRIFVDEGPPMARLLYEACSRGIVPDYVQRLLAAFPVEKPEQTHRTQTQSHESEWIEPLSDRELEVLRLIAKGLSRQEIASQLVLSLNTIKTHARNIYGKLGVNSQMQAAGKARTLGLLENE